MAEEHKKSLLLYFDSYPCLAALPADQRGELLILLFRYAMAADQGPADPEVLLAEYPCLDGEARMAYRFLAESVRRDTEKWKAKQRRYQEAAQRRLDAGEVLFTRRTEAGEGPVSRRAAARTAETCRDEEAWRYV